MREISIKDVADVRIGQVENAEAGTGCTVIIREKSMPAGVDVRGGGPASRETELLSQRDAASAIHALVLGGGSAFGLDAAGGVMQCLEERGIGYDTGICKVPLVCQSDIFDLSVGSKDIRPDKTMGYAACEAAFSGEKGNYRDGNFGAGCGASVGKLKGMEYAMKSGIGSYAVEIGELRLGAIVAVNALGDVFDHESGRKLAGLLDEEKSGFASMLDLMLESTERVDNKFTGDAEKAGGAVVTNTTIGAVITNAEFTKHELAKIASMAQNGLARAIKPVHTSPDGDTVYALSAGDVSADQDLVGTLAAEVMAEAIKRAVTAAAPAYGLKAASDFR